MGSDLTVFLEFYGLPGCGKSTVSHLVAEELRKQGKKVIEPTYDLDHKYSDAKRKTLKFLMLLVFAIVHPQKNRKLTRLIIANGYKGTEMVSQAANIAFKLLAYEKADTDYVIFDEGLTQSAISLCQGKRNSVENEAKLYGLCKKRSVYKLYINIDIVTALERMAGRRQHDSRIEKITDALEQEKAIKAFEKQCDEISSEFSVNDETVEECVDNVMRQIQDEK